MCLLIYYIILPSTRNRKLSKEQLQKRFDTHQKLHDFEIDFLFKDVKPRTGFTSMQYRYLEKGIRYQGIFDIETADFDPTEKFIICYNFTIRDIVTGKLEHMEDSITKDDIKTAVSKNNFHFDYRLLETLSWNIQQVDHLIGHFSSKFDVPYFRSRCLLTGRPELIPPYGSIRYGDTWRLMKNTMKAKRNTLRNFIIQTTHNDEKTFVDLKYWFKIYFPDNVDWQKSMDYIQKHCQLDVKMTVNGLKIVEMFNAIGMQQY